MYSEDSFKNYIFWIKVKRVFLMIIFSIIGALIGIAISDFFVNILLFESFFRIIIIAISTLIFFGISLLLTANTGKEIQEGYWKIAVLRKLTVISKKLDHLEKLDIPVKEILQDNIEKQDISKTATTKQNSTNNNSNKSEVSDIIEKTETKSESEDVSDI